MSVDRRRGGCLWRLASECCLLRLLGVSVIHNARAWRTWCIAWIKGSATLGGTPFLGLGIFWDGCDLWPQLRVAL